MIERRRRGVKGRNGVDERRKKEKKEKERRCKEERKEGTEERTNDKVNEGKQKKI